MSNASDEISTHILELGLGALAHANWHANFTTYSPESRYWPELSVLQAAHAGELLIKAKIAEEHPLLIFEHLPKASSSEETLSLQSLIENGRTYQFYDLPDRLWATTGMRLPAIGKYREFGKLRNTLQHFRTPPGVDFTARTIEFIYQIIDPFIQEAWGLYAIDYCEDYEGPTYLVDTLVSRGALFLVSSESTKYIDFDRLDWSKADTSYRAEMERRFAEAAQQRLSRTNSEPL